MSAGAPWSVKGIDAKAREVAKDLARRSGMTLGEWLNQMILDGEDVGALISREKARGESRDAEPDYTESLASRTRRPEPPRAEAARRPLPFSSSTPLASKDLRRHSIFDDRPRQDVPYREQRYAEPRYDDGYEDPRGRTPAPSELDRVAEALENLGARIEGSETRSASAVRGVSHAVESLLGRMERSESAFSEIQGKLGERAQESIDRVSRAEEDQTAIADRLQQAERLIGAQAERLEGLSGHLREEREKVARLEQQARSPQSQDSVRAVEAALGKLANQLYEGDARTRDSLKDVREDMLGLSHRLAQAELRDPERAAQGVIDKVVARMAQRLDAAEAQTATALRGLEQAFKALDGRMNHAEERGDVTDPETVRSLSRLANDLSRRVDESRSEMLTALQSGAQDSVEKVMAAVNERIERSERHQATAFDRMGQDILRVADNLNRRVTSVEAAGQDGLSRIAGEVSRIADSVETRFSRVDATHAEALERLGGEIARISERLATKITETERRATETVSAIGEQIHQQRDHVRSDFESRIRDSEERTQKLLEDARMRIDQKLAQVQTQSLLSETSPLKAPAAGPRDDGLPNPFAAKPLAAKTFGPRTQSRTDIENVAFANLGGGFESDDAEAAEADEAPLDLVGHMMREPLRDSSRESEPVADFDPFADDDADADLLEDTAPVHAAADYDDDDYEARDYAVEGEGPDPFADIEFSRKTAPRQTASHQAASRENGLFGGRALHEPEGDDDLDVEYDMDRPSESLVRATRLSPIDDQSDEPTPVSVSTRDALAAARAAVRASIEGTPEARKPAATKGVTAKAAASPDNLLTKTIAASTLAMVVAGGILVGYLQLRGGDKPAASEVAATPPTDDTTLAATAVVSPSQAEDPLHQRVLSDAYGAAVKGLEAHAPGAIDKLAGVANLGYAPAQFRLGDVYAGQGNLMKADQSQARLWYGRAAQGGMAGAMYNLGIMEFNGIGGAEDRAQAALWFRKSAERGVLNGQYNLGLLYQSGTGVEMNPSEAFKWFSIAAKSGDHDAAEKAAEVKSQLSDAQITKVRGEVDGFTPIAGNASAADTAGPG